MQKLLILFYGPLKNIVISWPSPFSNPYNNLMFRFALVFDRFKVRSVWFPFQSNLESI